MRHDWNAILAGEIMISSRIRRIPGQRARQMLRIALAAVFLASPGAGAARAQRRVVDETGRAVTIPDRPQRLVSLAPSITETVYALGAQDRLVGDTDYCDYPPAAKLKSHVGSVLDPSLEKIVALKPDLVLGTPEANRRETADQLARLGIPLYGVTAHDVDGLLRSVNDLGTVLDESARAQALVASLRSRIAAIQERVGNKPRPKVLFVVWYQPLITAGRGTFISDVIRRAGGESISDDLSGDWPRLSLEEVLRCEPKVILFPQSASFSPSVDDLRRLDGWKDLRAVKEGRVFKVSDSIVHPSPRLIDALEQVAAILHPLPSAAAIEGGCSGKAHR